MCMRARWCSRFACSPPFRFALLSYFIFVGRPVAGAAYLRIDIFVGLVFLINSGIQYMMYFSHVLSSKMALPDVPCPLKAWLRHSDYVNVQ